VEGSKATEFYLDRAYDPEEKIRRQLRAKGIIPKIAKSAQLLEAEWVNPLRPRDGGGAGLFQQSRLWVSYEKRDDIHLAFLPITLIMVCWNKLAEFC
jgi:hypothetical protein